MLDLKKLLDMQKELDKTILDNAGIKEYPLENIKLALLVELGELANEWKGFKHWKKDKTINRNKLLEEFADCLSFGLSLQNYLQQKSIDIDTLKCAIDLTKENKKEPNLTKIFIEANQFVNKEEDILLVIICLGASLDITLDEMEQAYLNKNKVNYERQSNGY